MDDPLDALYWRDEIMQIMYWLRDEAFGVTVAPQDLVTFLPANETRVAQYLEQLADDGYVRRVKDQPGRYQLTEVGVREGGRRFIAEFAELTKSAHGICSNPNCSCHTEGPEACESHNHSH